MCDGPENVEELQVPKSSNIQRVSVQITSPLSVSEHVTHGHLETPAAILRRYLDSLPQHPSPKIELKSVSFWRAIRSEFVASFLLTVVSSAAAPQPFIKISSRDDLEQPLAEMETHTQPSKPTSNHDARDIFGGGWSVEWALGHGLVLGALTWAIGSAHFSLPTTIALFVARKISAMRAFLHVLAQIAGALLAAPVLLGLLPRPPRPPVLSEGVTAAQAWGIEFLSTLLVSLISLSSYETPFVLTRISNIGRSDSFDDCTTPRIVHGALLPLVAAHSSAAMLTAQFAGIGLNPARSLAIAILTNKWSNHWIWWIGPLLGGFVAAFTHEYTGARDARSITTVANTPRPSIVPRDYSRPSCLLTSTPASPS